MFLKKVEVKNFRSLWDDGSGTTDFEFGENLNQIVGPNNCGKSNVLEFIRLALDDTQGNQFDFSKDLPVALSWGDSYITLTFQLESNSGTEKTVKKYAKQYEKSVEGVTEETYADSGLIKLTTQYSKSDDGSVTRDQFIQARGTGFRRGKKERLDYVLEKIYFNLKFVFLKSGQNLTALLESAFSELLNEILETSLSEEFERVQKLRKEYISDVQDNLLKPLSEHVSKEVGGIFPQIKGTEIVPKVRTIDEIISEAEFHVEDIAKTILERKGTGVRGSLLLSLLRYI